MRHTDLHFPPHTGGTSEYDVEFDANKESIIAAIPDPFPLPEGAAAAAEDATEAGTESVFNVGKMAAGEA